MITCEESKFDHPIFNGEYELISLLGKGRTSLVYKARSIHDRTKIVAIKVLIDAYLKFEKRSVEKEIMILKQLKHKNIIDLYDWGDNGTIKMSNGVEATNLLYLITEVVTNGCLFKMVQSIGKCGEDSGRFFMRQMLEVLQLT